MSLTKEDRLKLQTAKDSLENPGFMIKVANLLGQPIEEALRSLPSALGDKVEKSTHRALELATDIALFTLKDSPEKAANINLHKITVIGSGGLGGFFGTSGLLAELPFSTIVMLRSIADIARSHGESISTPDTKAACIEVFAMGGPSKSDDASESIYYASRIALAREITAAAEFLAQKTIVDKSGRALVKLLTSVVERFGIQVAQKTAFQLVPLIGAFGGASINLLFISHFQSMACGHFEVRRLERQYGKECVEAEYRALCHAS